MTFLFNHPCLAFYDISWDWGYALEHKRETLQGFNNSKTSSTINNGEALLALSVNRDCLGQLVLGESFRENQEQLLPVSTTIVFLTVPLDNFMMAS